MSSKKVTGKVSSVTLLSRCCRKPVRRGHNRYAVWFICTGCECVTDPVEVKKAKNRLHKGLQERV